jgi:serine/threonine-protein kinase
VTTPRLLGGRYELGETLGYGGMAEVHRGRDTRLGREVAIKVLRQDLARDNGFQARFEREAQNSASLNHPEIVAVYDTGEEILADETRLPYIVTCAQRWSSATATASSTATSSPGTSC